MKAESGVKSVGCWVLGSILGSALAVKTVNPRPGSKLPTLDP